jgi:hypothetical protein
MTRLALLILACGSTALLASFPSESRGRQKWYAKAVKKVEGAFTPAKAKPGETVTFSLTVELNEGYNTYPTTQPEKAAAGMVNEIKFPPPGTVIFVGKLQEPKNTKTKPEPELKIAELHYCTGTTVFTRKAVVSPKAAAGEATIKLASFRLSVCDRDNCFPPKAIPIEASLEVLDAPALPVEKEYADEVKAALEDK